MVFILPLSYQSFHIIHHHSENECKNHDLHHSVLISTCNDNSSISETETECVICDYEFTTYDCSETQPTISITDNISFIQTLFYQTITLGFLKQLINRKEEKAE